MAEADYAGPKLFIDKLKTVDPMTNDLKTVNSNQSLRGLPYADICALATLSLHTYLAFAQLN